MEFGANLQKIIDERGIAATLISGIGDTPTVMSAAAALAVTVDQIVKTLLFFVDSPILVDRYVLVISHGDRKVSKVALGAKFGVGKKHVTMAPREKVLEMLGYPAGGVPPFGHAKDLPIVMESGLASRPPEIEIFAGGGDHETMMKLTIAELLRVTKPMVASLAEA